MGDREEGRILILSLEKAKESILPYIYRTLDTIFVFHFPSNPFDYIQKNFFFSILYTRKVLC